MSGYDTNASAHMQLVSHATHTCMPCLTWLRDTHVNEVHKAALQSFVLHYIVDTVLQRTGAQIPANAVEMARPHAVIYLVES